MSLRPAHCGLTQGVCWVVKLPCNWKKPQTETGADSVGTGKESRKFEASLRHKKPCLKTKHQQSSHTKLYHIPITKMEEALLRPSLYTSRLGPQKDMSMAVGRSPGCCLLLVQVEKIASGLLALRWQDSYPVLARSWEVLGSELAGVTVHPFCWLWANCEPGRHVGHVQCTRASSGSHGCYPRLPACMCF